MSEQELSVREKQELKTDEPTRAGRTYLPDVDIYETPDTMWVWADMPGVDESSVDIGLADGVLTIGGRVSVQEYDSMQPIYTEYRVGNYLRRFTLSNDVDTDRIAARISNGVLELELPKTERAKPRRIAVTAS